jgi:Flp pilus assembly protein TadD
MAAVGAAEALPEGERRRALQPLLRDPTLAVRVEAARVLAPLRGEDSEAGPTTALGRALAEYRGAQDINAERPEAHVNLGILHARLGELEAAEREYETAIRLGPFFVPAYANLADLHRSRNRDDEGERVLRRGLARVRSSPDLHHALGLLLARQKRSDEALEALGRAAKLAPENPRYAYVYGIALHSAGEERRALARLEESHRAHPGDPDLLVALATLYRDRGDRAAALHWARKLLALRPSDPSAQALVRQLEAASP